MARISDADKDAIRNAYALGRANMVVLAQQWQCSKSYIHRIIHQTPTFEAALHQDACGVPGPVEYPAETGHTEQFNPFIGWWYPHRGYRDRVYMTKPQRRYTEER